MLPWDTLSGCGAAEEPVSCKSIAKSQCGGLRRNCGRTSPPRFLAIQIHNSFSCGGLLCCTGWFVRLREIFLSCKSTPNPGRPPIKNSGACYARRPDGFSRRRQRTAPPVGRKTAYQTRHADKLHGGRPTEKGSSYERRNLSPSRFENYGLGHWRTHRGRGLGGSNPPPSNLRIFLIVCLQNITVRVVPTH